MAHGNQDAPGRAPVLASAQQRHHVAASAPVKGCCLLQAGCVSEPVLAALTRRILTGLLQLHKGRHTVSAPSTKAVLRACAPTHPSKFEGGLQHFRQLPALRAAHPSSCWVR